MSKVFLDVGGHFGESLLAAVDPRWRFDRIYSFEPTSVCLKKLMAFGVDERVRIVPAGLWSSTKEMTIYSPGNLAASVSSSWSGLEGEELCQFRRASDWFAENLTESDQVWMKVNVEGAEIEVINDLLDSGQIKRVHYLVVHFDSERCGRSEEATALKARLVAFGANWESASTAMFGRNATEKCTTWLFLTHGNSCRFRVRRINHNVRASIFRKRKGLRFRLGKGPLH